MEGVKKKSFGQPHAGRSVASGAPFAPVHLHQALPQKAAQCHYHARPLGRPQLLPLRLNKVGQMGHALGNEGFQVELGAHLLGGGLDGIKWRWDGIGIISKGWAYAMNGLEIGRLAAQLTGLRMG